MRLSFRLFPFVLVLSSMTQAAWAGLLIPTPESSAAIVGKVVDHATGKPLPGVLVVATWHDFTPKYLSTQIEGGPQYSCYQLVNVITATTGADGSFEIPAWAGKLGHCEFMAVKQPMIVLYKPGYATTYTGDEQIYHPYGIGADHTVSEWDGSTFRLFPLGPHLFQGQDSYVANLESYASSVGMAVANDQTGPCFQREESPVLLLLLQEERRLSPYEPVSGKVFDHEIMGPRCMDQAALKALEQQSAATVPDVPILPYVRFADFPPGARQPGMSQYQGSALPPEVRDYIKEESAPGHVDDERPVLYHVNVNPENPYFLAMLRVGEGNDNAIPAGRSSTSDAATLAQSGIYGLSCPANIDEPSAHSEITSGTPERMVSTSTRMVFRPVRMPDGLSPAQQQAWLEARMRMANPATVSQTPASGTVANRLGQGPTVGQNPASDGSCSWTVALVKSSPAGAHWNHYDVSSATWTLTEGMLVRPKPTPQPEILEIHGPDSLSVTTTLVAAGPHRWRLPPPGQPFTLSITDASAAAEPGDLCARELPASLRLKMARDFGEFRLIRASDLPAGTTVCPDVVRGDFAGTGTSGYAFHLVEYDIIQRLAVAMPEGEGWTITTMNLHGCVWPAEALRAVRGCTMRPAASGQYTKTSRSWEDPYLHDFSHLRIANFDPGNRDSIQAPNPGFIETWDAPVAYAHFLVDGKWLTVIVDAPSSPAEP